MKPLPVVSISVLEGEGFLRQAVIFRNCWAEEAKCGGEGRGAGLHENAEGLSRVGKAVPSSPSWRSLCRTGTRSKLVGETSEA